MLLTLIYAVGVAATLAYAYRNLNEDDYDGYFRSAIIVTSLIWPLIVLAVMAICLGRLWKGL